MRHQGTFIGIGLTLIIFGGWALGFWYVTQWVILAKTGSILIGIGLLLLLVGLFFRWQGWQ